MPIDRNDIKTKILLFWGDINYFAVEAEASSSVLFVSSVDFKKASILMMGRG